MTVEGHHDDATTDVAAALADLEALIRDYARPDAMTSGMVGAETPTFGGL